MIASPTSLLPVKAIVVDAGVLDQRLADLAAGPGQVLHDAGGHARLAQDLARARAAMSGDWAAGLRMAQLPAARAPAAHAADDRQGEVPGRDDRGHAAAFAQVLVVLAQHVAQHLRPASRRSAWPA